MALQTWMPWVITSVYLYTQVAIGNKNRRAFLVAFAMGLGTMYYNIATEQFGFIAGNIFGCAIAIRNYVKWRSEKEEGHACCDGECLARRGSQPVDRDSADRIG